MIKSILFLLVSSSFFSCSLMKTRDHSEEFKKFEEAFPVKAEAEREVESRRL